MLRGTSAWRCAGLLANVSIDYTTDTTVESLWSEIHAMVISESGQVPSDFNGDGQSHIAAWRPGNGYWYILGQGEYQWGISSDIPLD